MIYIPWRYVKSWNCVVCGMCCKGYQVVLNFNEWVNIVRSYGVEATQPGINNFYLGKKSDGTCLFLYRLFDKWLCGIQNTKPKACKLWPFKIVSRPKFGRPNEGAYKYGDKDFFVYADPSCIGITWGKPTQEFAYKTLPEFIEVALGSREKQCYSTSRIPYRLKYFKIRGRKIV